MACLETHMTCHPGADSFRSDRLHPRGLTEEWSGEDLARTEGGSVCHRPDPSEASGKESSLYTANTKIDETEGLLRANRTLTGHSIPSDETLR